MKRHMFLCALAVMLFSTIATSKVIHDLGTAGRDSIHVLGADTLDGVNPHILYGKVYYDDHATLFIPAGATILGDTGSVGAALVIKPGAKIFAVGTSSNPIVFTSERAEGNKAPGDWGGVVILGRAPTNQAAPIIEGGILGADATYGGGGIGLGDPHDNSGVLQYVRIEFAGYRYQLNNEINGLTFGGVGDGTVVDHIEVAYAYDDSYEWFGGTVNCKYLIAFGGTDDDFDTDFGFSGRLQFCFSYRDPAIWDPTGESNGFESDNNNNGGGNGYSTDYPRTACKMANITLVGPRRTNSVTLVPGNRFQYGVVERRATRHNIYNTIIAGFPGGYSLRDIDTFNGTTLDSLQTRGLSMACNGDAGFKSIDYRLSNSAVDSTPVKSWLQTAAYNNQGVDGRHQPDDMGLTNMATFSSPDPRPSGGFSTAAADWTGSLVATDGFFTHVTYRGAFDPAVPMNNVSNWALSTVNGGWTRFDYTNAGSSSFVTCVGWNMLSCPRAVTDFTPESVFPNAEPATIWNYTGSGYVHPTTISIGVGYWALYASPRTLTWTGRNIPGTSYAVSGLPAGQTRWIQLGVGTNVVPWTKINCSEGSSNVPQRIEPNTTWDYANCSGTVHPTVTAPGKGYWLLMNGGATGATCTVAIGQ